MKKPFIILIFLILIIGCTFSKIPTEKLSQFEFPLPKLNVVNNNLEIYLKNPVRCPLRIWIETQDDKLQSKLSVINPIEIKEFSDTLITVPNVQFIKYYSYRCRLGSVFKSIKNKKIALPFPNGKKYKVIQGNNSNYTHNTDWSRYAVDFALKINDTICAATSGFIVGVIDEYKYGGKGNEWKPYGNFITIYEPNSGVFTQYVHLTENGSFVKVGDKVKLGEPIGLSGMSGQTDIEHLHFNCLIPTNSDDGLKSIPFEFIGNYKSTTLKKGLLIENKLTTTPKLR